MNSSSETLARPVQVLHAVRLLFASLGIGLLQIYIKAPGMTKIAGSGRLMFLVPVVAVIVAIFFILIGRGKNWARMFLLISYSIGVLALPGRMEDSFRVSTFSGTLCVVQAGLQLWALILLFQTDSSAWFRRSSARRAAALADG